MVCGDTLIPFTEMEALAQAMEQLAEFARSRLLTESGEFIDNPFTDLYGPDTYQNPFHRLDRASAKPHERVIQVKRTPSGELLPRTRDSDDPTELLYVLALTSGARCSDSRDCVYGILGMTNAKHGGATNPDLSDDPFLLVNYNRSISQMYQDVLYYFIEQGETLRIFFLLCIEGATLGGEAGNERLPTWCPNLSIPWGRAAGSITYDVTERMKSFSLGPRTPYRLSPIDRSSHIRHLRGFGIAEVVRNTGHRRRYWFRDSCGQSEDLFGWPYTWIEVSYAWLSSNLSLEFGKQKLGVDLKDVQKLARRKTRWATSRNESN